MDRGNGGILKNHEDATEPCNFQGTTRTCNRDTLLASYSHIHESIHINSLIPRPHTP